MSKIFLFIFLLNCNVAFSQIKDSTHKVRTIFIEHETILSLFGNFIGTTNNSSYKSSGFILTGSVGYKFNAKKLKISTSLNYNLAFSSYKYKKPNAATIYSDDTKRLEHNQFFLWQNIKCMLDKNNNNFGFYASAGLGGGTTKYITNGIINEKEFAWCTVEDIGYSIPIKRFYINTFVGLGTYFAFKKIIDEGKGVQYNTEAIYNYEKIQTPELKSVTQNGTQVIRTYGQLGLNQHGFFPRLGIILGFYIY